MVDFFLFTLHFKHKLMSFSKVILLHTIKLNILDINQLDLTGEPNKESRKKEWQNSSIILILSFITNIA